MSYYEAIEELEQDIKELKSSITQQAAVIEQMRHIIRRYRDDTPLGNQPYMLAHSADEILALQPCPEVLNKVRADVVREAAKWVGFTTNCNCNLHMMDFADRIEKGEREMNDAFKQWYVDTDFDPMAYNAMQTSWNAALEHAANICRAKLIGTGKYDHPVDISYDRAETDCAEAIRKEKQNAE